MRGLEQTALQLKAAGRFDEAAAAFAQLIRAQPKHHGHHYNLGNTLLAANRPAEAVEPFRRAVRLAPRFAPAHNNLGLALLATGQFALAAASFARAVALEPANPAMQHLAGHALLRCGQEREALPYLREANRLAPEQAAIVTDLADALRRAGVYAEAAQLARSAARLAPERIEVWNNLANALRDVGAFDEAAEASRAALKLDAENAEAHYNLALTMLTAGRLEEAWPHWEYRWRGVVNAVPRYGTRPWDGRPLGEGVLYLHAEQGIGDTIQFCRYATLAADRARVVLAVQKPLVRLLQSLAGVHKVVDLNDAAPGFAAQCPLASLPGVFGTSSATIPVSVPYLAPEEEDAARWSGRLGTLSGRRIGLVWAGNPDFPFDHARSIPAGLLDGLDAVAGVSFVSLQIGGGARPNLRMADWTAELHDFAATAGLVAGLDLVIAVDTAVIHLAGAMGKAAWLLNRYASDWRWGCAGDVSSWYPTLRIFRQKIPGDWAGVLAEVRWQLAAIAAS